MNNKRFCFSLPQSEEKTEELHSLHNSEDPQLLSLHHTPQFHLSDDATLHSDEDATSLRRRDDAEQTSLPTAVNLSTTPPGSILRQRILGVHIIAIRVPIFRRRTVCSKEKL